MTDAKEIINELIRKSTSAWFETKAKIWAKDRTKGLITPKVNYLQRKIQRTMEKLEEDDLPVRVIELKPRARGSTTYITGIGYTKMRRGSTSAVFIGGQSDQTVGLWNMMKTYHENDSFDWKNTGEVNEKGAKFSNGSRAKKESARDVQAGIGDTYNFLQCTEAARWAKYGVANAEDVMNNILKAVPLLSGTCVFLESTAEGNSGDFYRRWLGAVDCDDYLSGKVTVSAGDYVKVFAPWFAFEESSMPKPLSEEEKNRIESTIDAEEWYSGEQMLLDTYGVVCDDGVKRIGDYVRNVDWCEQLYWRRYAIDKECSRDKDIFDRDYPHSWQTAFQKSGNQRFGTSGLAEIRRRSAKMPPQYGILEEAKEKCPSFRSTSSSEAKIILYEKPVKGCKYIVGVDPMTGITQAGGADPDYHAVFVLRDGYYKDSPTGSKWMPPATVARVVRNRWDIPILEPEIWKLSRFYGPVGGGCTIVIEMNMDRGCTELLKQRGANLYRREMFNKVEQKSTNAYGFVTNERTRENLIEKLAGAIRCIGDDGNGIDIYDQGALDQFDNFVRKANGRSEAGEGFKDDDVFGVGLAFEVIGHATTYWPPVVSKWYQPPEMMPVQPRRTPGAFS